jgi:hypothetical protein
MINPQYISACFITKDHTYPKEIIDHVFQFTFGEFLFLTNCDSPHRKQELFEKASFDYIYYQDDDCIAPIPELLAQAKPHIINCAMKSFHLNQYKDSRIALVGWGSIFPKRLIKVLDKYRNAHGEDELYQRETERIMTYLNFPQNRLELPIVDLPSATAPDRLSMQPNHYNYIPQVEERCKALVEA